MSWKKGLDSNQRQAVITALDLEMTSPQKTILTTITKDDEDFALAVKTATPRRLLLDIKRSGKYKVRGVKQGFKEDKELSDSPNFNLLSKRFDSKDTNYLEPGTTVDYLSMNLTLRLTVLLLGSIALELYSTGTSWCQYGYQREKISPTCSPRSYRCKLSTSYGTRSCSAIST